MSINYILAMIVSVCIKKNIWDSFSVLLNFRLICNFFLLFLLYCSVIFIWITVVPCHTSQRWLDMMDLYT